MAIPARGGIKSMFRRKTKEALPQQAEPSTSAASQQLSSLVEDTNIAEDIQQERVEIAALESQPMSAIETVLPDTPPQDVPKASLSSKPLLTSFSGPPHSPTGSPDRSALLHGGTDADAYDPLSTAYEEHVSTPVAKLAPSREADEPASAADFDPLAATYEEYNLWQMTQQQLQQQGVETSQLDMPNMQGTDSSAPASPAAITAARKTMSIPGFFKMRKTSAAATEASDTAQTSSTGYADSSTVTGSAEDVETASMQVQVSGSDAASTAGSPKSGKAQKSHKRGLSMLMRRTRSNLGIQKQSAQTDSTQAQPEVIEEEDPAMLAAEQVCFTSTANTFAHMTLLPDRYANQ